MGHIKGQTVTVFFYLPDYSNKDKFGYLPSTYEQKDIPNVLITPVSSEQVNDSMNILGTKEVYQLALPKGDNNRWNNAIVFFNNRFWHVTGADMGGQEDLIPLDWNKKVTVENYYGQGF
ncbi:MAG: hypothetical protein Q4A55_07590 [Aerococcus sp.]|nr:hypothetical protein [Aerococcus sp.]